MSSSFRPASRSRNAAFSLVEVTVALGIMGFCLLAIFGLLPVGINSNRNAISTTEAAGVVSNVAADVHALAAGDSSRYGISLPGTTVLYFSEVGEMTNSADAVATKYRVEVTSTADDSNADLFWVRTQVSWPAPANPQNAAGTYSAMTAVKKKQT